MDNRKKENNNNLKNYTLAGSVSEIVQKYGSANKEHLVAYSGIDNEAGKVLKRSLDSISRSKVNPDNKFQNLHQQAGFSAEVKSTANTNAENIIKGKKTRKVRTDDMGMVNHEYYDHFMVDENGNIIDGSGSQMKFIGASQKDPLGIGAPKRALDKLQDKKFEKYLDADAKIEVPSDYYDKMMHEADKEIASLQQQMEAAQKNGKSEVAQTKKAKIEKLKKIKKNLRKSSVSSEEAMEARLHPKLSTAKSIVKISHRAGVETAKTSALIGGTVSMTQNLIALCKGEVDASRALKNVAKDTGTSAVIGYGTGFLGSTVKGAMQNASSGTVRALAKTNLPATLVACGIATTKVLKKYFDGEIDGVQCFQELGEQGTGMLSSALFATIGQAVIPIPVVGGMIGGMLGYAISSASYGVLMQALEEKRIAREQRIIIEKACEEHIRYIRQCRAELEKLINEYLAHYTNLFETAFSDIKTALEIGDVDGVISGANKITTALGKEVQFSNKKEFDQFMASDVALKF